MGWFSDWLDKDKVEKETFSDVQIKVKGKSNIEIINESLPDLVDADHYVSVFKDNEGNIYGADEVCSYKREYYIWTKALTNTIGNIVNIDLSKVGYNPINTKEEYQKMLDFLERHKEIFIVYNKVPVQVDKACLVDKTWLRMYTGHRFTFLDWLKGRIVAATPELKMKAFIFSNKWETFQAVINEATRLKLDGDLVVLTKGGNRSILLKEYFDHKWIDLGLKGTLFVQDIDNKEATSWSDVNVDRVTLSSMVKDIQNILDEAVGCEQPEEVKNVVHYLNKAREIIGGEV